MQFFEKEKNGGRLIPLKQVVDRTISATKISKNIISKIWTETDLDTFPDDNTIFNERSQYAPQIFISIIRSIIFAIVLTEKKNPTLTNIYEKRTEQDYDFDENYDKPVWEWSLETMRRLLKITDLFIENVELIMNITRSVRILLSCEITIKNGLTNIETIIMIFITKMKLGCLKIWIRLIHGSLIARRKI